MVRAQQDLNTTLTARHAGPEPVRKRDGAPHALDEHEHPVGEPWASPLRAVRYRRLAPAALTRRANPGIFLCPSRGTAGHVVYDLVDGVIRDSYHVWVVGSRGAELGEPNVRHTRAISAKLLLENKSNPFTLDPAARRDYEKVIALFDARADLDPDGSVVEYPRVYIALQF